MPSTAAKLTVQQRQQQQPQRRRAQLPSDAVYADTKCFQAKSGVIAMVTAHNGTMWLAMQDGRVEVRDAHTGQALHEFGAAGARPRRSRVWCLLAVFDVLSQEGQIWMGLSSGAIEVYTEGYELRRQLSKHLSGVYCLAQYRGAVVYAGSSDFTITQWRVKDGQLLRVLNGHRNYVRCLYAEGNALVSGSDDNTIRVWDSATGQCLQVYDHLHRESGGVSAVCRVGTTMWSGDHSGAVTVWKLKDGEALFVNRQLAPCRVTCLTKVGARVHAGSADGRICVFNASDCTVASQLNDHLGSRISAFACAVEVNRYFVWSGSADNTIRCWHHDEHQVMSSDREGFLDMRWYYTTQQPYLKANEEMLAAQREVAELLMLSTDTDEVVRGFLSTVEEGQESAAARYWLLNSKLRDKEKRCDMIDEEFRSLDATVKHKTEALELLKRRLTRLTDALQTARQNVPAPAALSPPPMQPTGALDVSAAADGVAPAASTSTLPPFSVPPPPPITYAAPMPPPPPATATPLSPPPVASVLLPAPASHPAPTTTFFSSITAAPPLSSATAPTAGVPPPLLSFSSLPQPSAQQPSASLTLPSVVSSAVVPAPSPIVTETHVTMSRSYEPVLPALPPPPSAAAGGGAPRKMTMGAILRMGSSAGLPEPSAAVPSPPVAVVPVPPPSAGAKTPADTPLTKPAAPKARRMSF